MPEELDASPLRLVLVNAQDQRCWHLVLHQCLLDVPKAFQAFVGANAEGVVQGHEPVEGGHNLGMVIFSHLSIRFCSLGVGLKNCCA